MSGAIEIARWPHWSGSRQRCLCRTRALVRMSNAKIWYNGLTDGSEIDVNKRRERTPSGTFFGCMEDGSHRTVRKSQTTVSRFLIHDSTFFRVVNHFRLLVLSLFTIPEHLRFHKVFAERGRKIKRYVHLIFLHRVSQKLFVVRNLISWNFLTTYFSSIELLFFAKPTNCLNKIDKRFLYVAIGVFVSIIFLTF